VPDPAPQDTVRQAHPPAAELLRFKVHREKALAEPLHSVPHPLVLPAPELAQGSVHTHRDRRAPGTNPPGANAREGRGGNEGNGNQSLASPAGVQDALRVYLLGHMLYSLPGRRKGHSHDN